MADELVPTSVAHLELAEDVTIAVTGMTVGLEIHLVKEDFEPGPNTLLADLVAIEADYDGYAAEAVTLNAASIGDDGEVEMVGIAGEFRPTGSVVTNSIYGGWLENGAGDYLGAFRFAEAPLPMTNVLDSILIVPRLRPKWEGIVELIS